MEIDQYKCRYGHRGYRVLAQRGKFNEYSLRLECEQEHYIRFLPYQSCYMKLVTKEYKPKAKPIVEKPEIKALETVEDFVKNNPDKVKHVKAQRSKGDTIIRWNKEVVYEGLYGKDRK